MVAKGKFSEGDCINEKTSAWEIIFVLEGIIFNTYISRQRLKGCVNLLVQVGILIPISWGVACVCDKPKGFFVSKTQLSEKEGTYSYFQKRNQARCEIFLSHFSHAYLSYSVDTERA